MTKNSQAQNGSQPPPLIRDSERRVEPSSLADVLQWFLSYDPRVAVVRMPAVEALYQWKREKQQADDEGAVPFEHAEDRFAVGVAQALSVHGNEQSLHGWISNLLAALDDAKKTNEAIAEAYGLQPEESADVIVEAAKIPSRRERDMYLTCCWLETLCTAEIRVLGWAYRELHGRSFNPGNF